MVININKLRNDAVLNIAPAKEEVTERVLADNHASQPIKKGYDIKRLSEYYISKGEYRNNMLFVLGINFGLRISDILELRFCDVINKDFTFKNTVAVFEKKTRNTRKKKTNRIITINSCVRQAIILYLDNTPNCSLSDYMFISESNNKSLSGNTPLTRQAADQIIKQGTKAIGLEGNYATHSLRKTFAYQYMLQHKNEPRALQLLQKMFNHKSMRQTLDYIGITEEEIDEAYTELGNYYDEILKYGCVINTVEYQEIV